MSRAALVIATCLLACAHDYVAGDVDPEGASGSATTTASTDASSESSGNDSAQTGEGTGGSGSASSSSSEGSNAETMGSNGPQLSALFVPGGLDRIRIFKLEPTLELCTIVTVVNAGENMMDVTVPPGWALESIMMTDNGDDCGQPGGPQGQLALATSMTGSVSWEAAFIPCDLDVAIQLELDAAWAPPADSVTGMNVAVEGCP